jgi:hypothetical protein
MPLSAQLKLAQTEEQTGIRDNNVEGSGHSLYVSDRGRVVRLVTRRKFEHMYVFVLVRKGLKLGSRPGITRAREDDGIRAFGEGLDKTEACGW